jgi:hypothetical protein
MKDTFRAYGPPDLYAWHVDKLSGGQGIFWFQTTDKVFSCKLSKRLDTRCVEVAGWNHFHWTYEMRIIDNYILSAGDRFFVVNRLLNEPKMAISALPLS